MKYLQPYVYELVKALIQERIDNQVGPYFAIETDLKNRVIDDVKHTIAELTADGVLVTSSNINGIGLYRFVDNSKKNEKKRARH
jgi:hypothetical protein